MTEDLDVEARVMPENLRGALAMAGALMAADRILRIAVVDRMRPFYDDDPHGAEAPDDELARHLAALRKEGVLDAQNERAVWRVKEVAESVRNQLEDVHLRWIEKLDRDLFLDARGVLAKCGEHWTKLVTGCMPAKHVDAETVVIDGHVVLLERLFEACRIVERRSYDERKP